MENSVVLHAGDDRTALSRTKERWSPEMTGNYWGMTWFGLLADMYMSHACVLTAVVRNWTAVWLC